MDPARSPPPVIRLEQIEDYLQPATSPCAAGGPEPRVGTPEHFNGDPHSCHAFLTNCSLLFSLQPSPPKLPRWRMTHLTERARLWARRSGSDTRPPAPHFRHPPRNCARFSHVAHPGAPQRVSCSCYGRGGGASWTSLSTFRLWPGTVGGQSSISSTPSCTDWMMTSGTC